MRKGSLVLDIRHPSSLKDSTNSLSNSTGNLSKAAEEAGSGSNSPKSPLANSSNNIMNGDSKARMFKAIRMFSLHLLSFLFLI
jgi:hypothetical protein